MAFERLAKFLGRKKEHPMRDNKNRIRPDRLEHQDEVASMKGFKQEYHDLNDRRTAYDEMLQKHSKKHKTNSDIAQKSPEGPLRHSAVRYAHESAREALQSMPGRKKVKSYR